MTLEEQLQEMIDNGATREVLQFEPLINHHSCRINKEQYSLDGVTFEVTYNYINPITHNSVFNYSSRTIEVV
jgi:hypothetical protein